MLHVKSIFAPTDSVGHISALHLFKLVLCAIYIAVEALFNIVPNLCVVGARARSALGSSALGAMFDQMCSWGTHVTSKGFPSYVISSGVNRCVGLC